MNQSITVNIFLFYTTQWQDYQVAISQTTVISINGLFHTHKSIRNVFDSINKFPAMIINSNICLLFTTYFRRHVMRQSMLHYANWGNETLLSVWLRAILWPFNRQSYIFFFFYLTIFKKIELKSGPHGDGHDSSNSSHSSSNQLKVQSSILRFNRCCIFMRGISSET